MCQWMYTTLSPSSEANVPVNFNASMGYVSCQRSFPHTPNPRFLFGNHLGSLYTLISADSSWQWTTQCFHKPLERAPGPARMHHVQRLHAPNVQWKMKFVGRYKRDWQQARLPLLYS